jgi:hypothetical protein
MCVRLATHDASTGGPACCHCTLPAAGHAPDVPPHPCVPPHNNVATHRALQAAKGHCQAQGRVAQQLLVLLHCRCCVAGVAAAAIDARRQAQHHVLQAGGAGWRVDDRAAVVWDVVLQAGPGRCSRRQCRTGSQAASTALPCAERAVACGRCVRAPSAAVRCSCRALSKRWCSAVVKCALTCSMVCMTPLSVSSARLAACSSVSACVRARQLYGCVSEQLAHLHWAQGSA